jgi:zeaxanthin glucosyltransferase
MDYQSEQDAMSYYAMLVPAFTGHLNPMLALAGALQRRGHRVAIVSALEAGERVLRNGLEFMPVALQEFPAGEWARTTAEMAELTGWQASRFAGQWLRRFGRGILRDLPQIVDQERFDGLVMDQISIGGESVCHVMKIPMAVACNSLLGHAESRVPPVVFSWPYRPGPLFRGRNILGQFMLISTGWPVVLELLPFRRKHRLPRLSYNHGNEMPPSLVQVAQVPEFFDFPRRNLPNHFHYTGPWTDPEAGREVSFPWEKLREGSLIFASFGTLQNRLAGAFRIVAEACSGLDAQLVLSLGCQGAEIPEKLPGEPIVVDYAPQRALLRRSKLVITHGGLNTALESLREGVPMVALPVTNDQPGVAARIKRLGAGEFIPIKNLTANGLRTLVMRVLASSSYRIRAQEAAAKICELNGAEHAAELLEMAFSTRKRVRRKKAITPSWRTSPPGL